MAADDLVMQGARALAAIMFPLNILALAPEGLKHHVMWIIVIHIYMNFIMKFYNLLLLTTHVFPQQ